MSSLGIIPIRFQSTRLPNKTFRLCANKPLIDWTIESARKSFLDDFIVVSSCKIVRQYCGEHKIKCVIRSAGLESDETSILHTISWLNESHLNNAFSIQMLLQITNPTRTIQDINECLALMNIQSINSVCSVVNVGEFHPSRMYRPTLGRGIEPLLPNRQWGNTQQLPKIYLRDGSIYCWRTDVFLKPHNDTVLPERVMSYEIESERSVRVDTLKDLERAEKYLTSQVGAVS